jgi:RNA polymerase sigma-70 factor (ECF subfamily)
MPPSHRPDDAELMRRVQADDAHAFRLLYDRHAPAALGAALGITRSPRVAEEAVQEAFLTLWRAREGYEPARGSVGGWLLSIVRSRSLDALRRSMRRDRPWEPLCEHDRADTQVEGLDELAMRREDRRLVLTAIAQLPREQATVLSLAYYAELTHAEIAAHLDVPLGTVKGRVRLAMRRLSAQLTAAPA